MSARLPQDAVVVSAASADSLTMTRLAGTVVTRFVPPSAAALARALRAARAEARATGGSGVTGARVAAVVPTTHPALILVAALEKAERIGVYHPEVGEVGSLRAPALRAAFALVDLTIVPDEVSERSAIRAGADPARIVSEGAEVAERLFCEPPRTGRARGIVELTASLALDAAQATGLLRLAELATPERGVNVVNYHRVLPVDELVAYGRPQMAIAAPVFEAQIDQMAKERGFAPVDAVYAPDARDKVAITFDDGYEDNYRVALPILERFSTPACIFVVTSLIGQPEALWWDQLGLALFAYWQAGARAPIPPALPGRAADLAAATSLDAFRKIVSDLISSLNAASQEARDRAVEAAIGLVPKLRPGRTMLTWDEVAAMARVGIHFGGHTKSHVPLDELPPETARDELFGAQAALSTALEGQHLGAARPNMAALPRGRLGALSEAEIRAGGIDRVMTTQPGVNRAGKDSLFVRRRDGRMLTLGGRHHPAKLRLELTGLVDHLRAVLRRGGSDY